MLYVLEVLEATRHVLFCMPQTMKGVLCPEVMHFIPFYMLETVEVVLRGL